MLAEAGVIDLADFARVDMRVGRVLDAESFPQARKPAYKLRIDFGSLGIRRSSAQLTAHYQPEDLRGRLLTAATNLPPRQIGPVRSELLVIGAPDAAGGVDLVAPTHEILLRGECLRDREHGTWQGKIKT